jgi:tetratricopeptide (TPR) repeat protein
VPQHNHWTISSVPENQLLRSMHQVPRLNTSHYALQAAEHLHVTPPSELYYARGQAYATRGDFDHARNDYERALDTAQAASDSVMEWRSILALGFLWAKRDYAQAGAWFSHTIELAAHLADPTLRARSLNRFGNWLSNTGRSEEGLQSDHEALWLFEQQHDIPGMAETFDLLGKTYEIAGTGSKRSSCVRREGACRHPVGML